MQNLEPNKQVPQEIHNLIGKSYTSQIKVDDYNFKEGCEVYTFTSAFKSKSKKHYRDIVANSIHIKHLETPASNNQTIANDPISASNVKLLASLQDITSDNIIDDLSGTTKLVRKQKLITNFILFASS